MLLAGDPDSESLDTYYYLLEDLHTVTGLVHKNGQLAEAYSYGAYGDVEMFGYHPHDLDRDGGVVDNDDRVMSLLAMHAGPADDPLFDVDFDGDSEIYDYGLVFQSYAAQAPSAVPLRTSGIGNPYFFTGSRRHFLDDLTTAGANDNKQLQYNRARHYDPKHGRWLQRDPAEYVDGMNLYEYVRNRPTLLLDWLGRDSCTPGQTCGNLKFEVVVGFLSPSGSSALGLWIAAADAYQFAGFTRAASNAIRVGIGQGNPDDAADVGYDVLTGELDPLERYFQILWMGHDQAAAFLTPSANTTPAITSRTSAEPFSALQVFEALSISLNTIVRHAVREPEPFVLRCRSRTVANVDSIGFVVRM